MAETTAAQADAPGTAPGAELTIPKYRLDEVSAELKRVREELQLKDRLYLEDRQRAAAERQIPPQRKIKSAEELGIDPQTYKAIQEMASEIADLRVADKEAMFGQQIGILAGRTEKAELIAKRGASETKYLDEIDRRQKAHFQATGGFLPAEMALDLIKLGDKDREIERLKAQIAGKAPPAETPESTSSGPSAAGTRDVPTTGASSGSSGKKKFSELTVEEMEAQMDERFKGGDTL